MNLDQYDNIRPVVWENNTLKLLDQRLLPKAFAYNSYTQVREVADAIRNMVVRGAPAIGITAAFAVVLAADAHYKNSPQDWQQCIEKDLDYLASSRPTAVNLFWALDCMRAAIAAVSDNPLQPLLKVAQNILNTDIAANKAMGSYGADLMVEGSQVLTHCNAGALATGGYGTALGVIRHAYAQGKISRVYADETRPWLQGSRLTAWELLHDGIPVTLQADGAAAYLMQQGKIQWIIVGSDRIAANGDVANKIGTYGLAVLAKYHSVKFMVVAPTSTIDLAMLSGDSIPIEQREGEEVLCLAGERMAASGADAWNPAFDVTPARLVDAIVTEKGVVLNPTKEKIRQLMKS
ncbi:MAG TPA: S-methyl-5-thioribose-1-phosphate isomerase [Gammaproteobacteria bacterium]|nr:S-methyl-5-thioribose-1-phosphate isomerase [Gammaproteobacteria bacterium]